MTSTFRHSTITVSAILVSAVAAHAQAITPFRTGHVEVTQSGGVLKVPAWREGSQLIAAGRGRWMLGLVYSTPQGAEKRVDVRIALGGLTGPGTYTKKHIDNLVVETDEDVWNFDGTKHDCTFTIARLDLKGVEGSASCTGVGVPFSKMTFVAAP